MDVDLKLLPEPKGVFEAIGKLKDELQINIELASPDQFIPPLPNWQSRSPFIAQHGAITFKHYDFYSQALSKLERGHTRDLFDVEQMLQRHLIEREKALSLFEAIVPDIIRYPSLELEDFRRRVYAELET